MQVSLIGATGNAGSRILAELVRRGHQVTAIVRHPEKVPQFDGVTARKGDTNHVDDLSAALRDHDVVVSSVHFLDGKADSLIGAVRQAGGPRYVVVGGAGSLDNGDGVKLIDAGGVPEPYRAESRAGCNFLETLQQTSDLDWTFLSPSAQFVPGERTGVFRLGADTALRDAGGRSWISYEDYAVALVDEIEQRRHSGRRFTVGY
ncbi:NAD(P)-dependent oxidoreductase [Bradyrhizobium diazoefficiens]|uniref:NAD(P)-dependent oxidoreductase n=1 Tax=Bradyrhizobium diazoefficiens TaxID=1355477 RepID=UPI00190C11FA|nr:NAD(P)-dependent oxidoreductase [Bradyrhizobium diazoefficiens]MBK3664945.1 NAD(P)-dependent oxidoreductase [Bradyrhizobium diazoefficiens]